MMNYLLLILLFQILNIEKLNNYTNIVLLIQLYLECKFNL
jgi:hypothetical protein